MNNDAFIHALLDAAKKAGIHEAEAYVSEADSLRVLVTKGEIEEYAVSTSGRLAFRGLINGKMGTSYTEALDEDAIPMLVEGVKDSARLITDEDEQFIYPGSPAYASVDCTGDTGTAEAQIDFALAFEKLGRTLDPRVTALGFSGMESGKGKSRMVNTHGLDLTHTDSQCVAFLDAIAREGERVSTNFAIEAAYSLANLDAEKIAKEAIAEAVFQLNASPCDSGEMPIIFRNTAMGSLLSVFAGAFSADAAQKGLSLLSGKEGQAIASPCVSLVDDPLLKGGFGTLPFDGEGVATFTKQVIQDGVLTTLLHNLKTAKKAGLTTTGNAARGAGSMGVAPSNFFFTPGKQSLEAMMAAAGNGLVVTEMTGLHAGANPISGDFSLLVKGYLIENGKASRPVEQVTVAGNFFQLLKEIMMIGSDLRFTHSSIASPSVWVNGLTVAGK